MKKTGAAKPVALRTCVVCRQVKDKRTLIRLVRTPQGNIEVDSQGKREGRGAYICPAPECWEKALKGNQLEHSLHARLTGADRDQLIKYGEDLLKGVD